MNFVVWSYEQYTIFTVDVGRRKLDGDGLRSSMAVVDGVLYVLGNSGSLHALDIEVK